MNTVVVGLGNIGAEIGARLAARVPVSGVETDAARRRQWSERTGSPSASSLGEVDWAEVSRAVVVVRSSAAAVELAVEIDELLPHAGACHLMTTLSVEDARSLARRTFARLRVLEQPVSGGASGARGGRLTVLSAGPLLPEDEAFLRSHLAEHLARFERYGDPTLTKLINNAAAAYHLEVLDWALHAAAAAGLSPGPVNDVLQRSSGASAIAAYAPTMGPGQGDVLAKDVGLLASALGELPALAPKEGALAHTLRRLHELMADSG